MTRKHHDDMHSGHERYKLEAAREHVSGSVHREDVWIDSDNILDKRTDRRTT